jgi:hypothetical protein
MSHQNEQNSCRGILLSKINELLEGKTSVPEFQDKYYDYFLDKVPDKSLAEPELMFFGLIQEQLDWTTENPGEDKKWGYKNYQEYTDWARKVTQAFLKDEDGWLKSYYETREM